MKNAVVEMASLEHRLGYTHSILATIGNTPLVPLHRMFTPFTVYAKLEMFNPAGSMKDRTALSIIEHELQQGTIQPGVTTIVESSSGNMGIGLAQVCAYYSLPFICVVDPKTTTQNIRMLKAYGAQVELVTEPSPVTGEFLHARLQRVQALCQMIPQSFWPNQYANKYNPLAHQHTMEEIVMELDRKIDFLFVATSTCGTIRGCSDYIHEKKFDTRVVAVDAFGSVIFDTAPGHRLIPGHGAAIRPELYKPGMADKVVHISDFECVVGCRRLLKQEAIMAGGSSGAVVMAIEKMKHEIPDDAVCAVILCDRGERYLDTIYNDSWVTEHFGDFLSL